MAENGGGQDRLQLVPVPHSLHHIPRLARAERRDAPVTQRRADKRRGINPIDRGVHPRPPEGGHAGAARGARHRDRPPLDHCKAVEHRVGRERDSLKGVRSERGSRGERRIPDSQQAGSHAKQSPACRLA
jgi:hypothetical protein